jgi:hypothetical protein
VIRERCGKDENPVQISVRVLKEYKHLTFPVLVTNISPQKNVFADIMRIDIAETTHVL